MDTPRTIDEVRPHHDGVRYLIGHAIEAAVDVLEDSDGNRSYWWTGTDIEPPENVREDCNKLIDAQAAS